MYDGGAQAVERYLGLSVEDLAATLLAGNTSVKHQVIHREHSVTSWTDAGSSERVIEGAAIEIHPVATHITKDELLAATSGLLNALAICGREFSKETNGAEIDTAAIYYEVFDQPSYHP